MVEELLKQSKEADSEKEKKEEQPAQRTALEKISSETKTVCFTFPPFLLSGRDSVFQLFAF